MSSIIAKSSKIIDFLAERAPKGITLSLIASGTRLNKATVHRVLHNLMDIGWVTYDPYAKRYNIGYKLLLIAEFGDLYNYSRTIIPEIYKCTIDISELLQRNVYLVVRAGLNSLCLVKITGKLPTRKNTLDVGSRRPLGIGAAGILFLAICGPAEAGEIIKINQPRFFEYNDMSVEEITEYVLEARSQNFAFDHGRVAPGVGSIALPIEGHGINIDTCIIISDDLERMTDAEQAKIISLIRRYFRDNAGSIRCSVLNRPGFAGHCIQAGWLSRK